MNEKLNNIIFKIQQFYPMIKLSGSYSHNLLGIHNREPNDLDFVISKTDFLGNFEKFKIEITNFEKYFEHYETEELSLCENKDNNSFDNIIQIRCLFENQQLCIFFEDTIESEIFKIKENLEIEIINPEISFNKKIVYVIELKEILYKSDYQYKTLEKHKKDIENFKIWKQYKIKDIMIETLKELVKLEKNLILFGNYSHNLLGIIDDEVQNNKVQNLEFYLSFEDFKKIEKKLQKISSQFNLKYDNNNFNEINKYVSKKINFFKTYNEYYIIEDFNDNGFYDKEYDKIPIYFECVINSINIKIEFNKTIDFENYKFEDFKIKISNPEIYFKNLQIQYLQEQINALKGSKNSDNIDKIKFELFNYNNWKFFNNFKLEKFI